MQPDRRDDERDQGGRRPAVRGSRGRLQRDGATLGVHDRIDVPGGQQDVDHEEGDEDGGIQGQVDELGDAATGDRHGEDAHDDERDEQQEAPSNRPDSHLAETGQQERQGGGDRGRRAALHVAGTSPGARTVPITWA